MNFSVPIGLPFGQVERGEAQAFAFDVPGALDEARLFVGIVSGQAAFHRRRRFPRQERDAVETLLAVRLHMPAARFEFDARKPSSTLLISCKPTMSGLRSSNHARACRAVLSRR